MIGQTISHYKILEELGRGGMGIVYKAEDTKLNRLVALKFLPPQVKEADEERARFMQEAQAAAALNHPNICTIYRIDEVDGKDFIEMELVEGETLRQKIPVKDLNKALEYGIQIAEALQEAHSKGIVHRDVKAENIMVNNRNQAKVMDFGLAKLKGTIRLTKTTSTVGTLAYMAPEQVQGSDVDHRSDVFSLGVVVFEMLTGHLPFRGEHDAALMYSILNEEPADPSVYLPDVPEDLKHILSRCLEKDAADRYQSAGDVAIELRRLRRDSKKVTRSGIREVGQIHTPSVPAQPSVGGARAGRVLLSVAAGLAVVAAAWFLLRPGGSDPVRFGEMRMKQITSIGTAGYAAISPDGRYIVHSTLRTGNVALKLRQIATMSSVEILPPSQRDMVGTTFSPDGNHIYIVYDDAEFPRGVVKRIPVLGGVPEATSTVKVASPVSISPDGQQYCFIRPTSENAQEHLMIANTDGTAERTLVTRYDQEFFLADDQGPAWSPDGDWIAVGVATTIGGFHATLMAYRADDGTAKQISDRRFYQIGRVAWLNDGAGVVFTAQEDAWNLYQLWFADWDTGEIVRLTNDLNSYGTVSLGLTEDDRSLVTLKTDATCGLWIVPAGRPDEARRVPGGNMEGYGGVAWSSDGKRIAYAATVSSNTDIWLLDPENDQRTRLTTDESYDTDPAFAPDGSVVYVSASTGTANIWRMKGDGTEKRQLTNSENYYADVTPDGKSVVYYGFATGFAAIWSSPLNGGAPTQLTKTPSRNPAVSPDGTRIACFYDTGPEQPFQIAILPIGGGEPIQIISRPATASSHALRWSNDGQSLLYVAEQDGAGNIWRLPLTGGPPVQVTMFREDNIPAFDIAPNGDILCARRKTVSDVVLIEDFRRQDR